MRALRKSESVRWVRRTPAGREEYAQDHEGHAAMQEDTPEQKQALCDLIDAIDGTIQSDWTGGYLTRAEAKAYVLEYDA